MWPSAARHGHHRHRTCGPIDHLAFAMIGRKKTELVAAEVDIDVVVLQHVGREDAGIVRFVVEKIRSGATKNSTDFVVS